METALFFSTIWRPGDIIIILHSFYVFYHSYSVRLDYLNVFQTLFLKYIVAIGVQMTNYLVKVQTT